MKAQVRDGLEASLKVCSDILFADHLSGRRPQELRGNWRGQFNRILIVGHDRFQIMGVPSGNPVLGQFPGCFVRHDIFSSA